MAQSQSASLRIIFGADTSGLDGALTQSLKKLENTSKRMASQGRALSRGLTAPLLAIAGTSLRTAVNFEASMAKVKAVSGATAGEFKALSDQAKELGRTTVFTASDVAGLQLEFSKLGFTAGQIQQVTESTLYLAQATGSDLASAAEVAGATLRGFGLEAEQTSHVTDVMAAAFSSSALDLTKFRESMKYVAPVAKAAGIGIEQATAMLGALANSGISGSQAGTALRRIISQLGATGGDVAGAIKKLSEEGLNLADAKDEVGRSAQTALLVLSESMGTVDDLTASLHEADGAASGMAGTMNDTADGAIRRMQSSIEGAQIAIGTALAPTLVKIVDKISAAATAFSELGEGTQHTIIGIAAFASAIGPALLVTSALITAYGKLTIATEGFTLAQIKARAAMLLNPYTALAAAAVAVSYGVYKAVTATTDMEKAQKRINDARQTGIDNYATEAAKVNSLAREYQLFEGDMDRRKQILDDLKAAAPKYFSNLDAEKTSYEDLAVAVNSYNTALRSQAIQQAFGDELTKIYADQLKLQEQIRDATIEQAEAQKVIDDGADQYYISAREGTRRLTAEGARLARATAAVDTLRTQETALTTAATQLEESIANAREELEGLVNIEGTDTGTDTGTDAGVDDKSIKTLADARKALEEALQDIAIEQLIQPDEEQRLRDTAKAYQDAAKAAYELEETEVAQEFVKQANASLELADALKKQKDEAANVVDAEKEIRKALQERLDQVKAATFTGADEEEQLRRTHDAYIQAAQAAFLAADPQLAAEFLKQAQALGYVADNANDAGQKMSQFFQTQAEQVVMAMDQMLHASIRSIGDLIEASVAAEEPLRGVGNALKAVGADFLTTLGGIAIEVGKTALATGTAVEAIKKALQSMNGVVAIVAGAALVALGAIMRGRLAQSAQGGGQVPALARGGITTGPTLSLIGDNPSGKEAVIPFERMDEFLKMAGVEQSAQQLVVTGRISGQDIVLSNERASRDRNRRR